MQGRFEIAKLPSWLVVENQDRRLIIDDLHRELTLIVVVARFIRLREGRQLVSPPSNLLRVDRELNVGGRSLRPDGLPLRLGAGLVLLLQKLDRRLHVGNALAALANRR